MLAASAQFRKTKVKTFKVTSRTLQFSQSYAPQKSYINQYCSDFSSPYAAEFENRTEFHCGANSHKINASQHF